ncbi:MAG: alpha/beta hydrolase [Desulfobacterales bacterium]|nr:alpha/beta hydrolase [Desulfobacterales bacterium]MBF0396586.1 alpha/beta hydrolase [Desulfobacterales bacterium]
MNQDKYNIKYFEKNGIKIEYLLEGDEQNDTIIFMHSMSANIKQFMPHVKYFTKEYRVLCMSYRGHGNSFSPKSLESYALSEFASDVKMLVDDLGIKSFHYVGNSFGGLIGYELLKLHPQYFKSMTTLGTPIEVPLSRLTAFLFALYMVKMLSLCKFNIFRKLISNIAAISEENRNFLYEEILNNVNLKTTFYSEINLYEHSYINLLQNVSFPFLIIMPEFDTIINFILKNDLKSISNKPNIQIKELKNAGHIANLDAPDELNKIISDFLNNINKQIK